jgi:hypothetical protein
MKDMVELSIDDRRDMGLKGRKKMEENFDEKIVVQQIVDRIESFLNNS